MRFTYEAYQGLLERLRKHGYAAAGYVGWEKYGRCVILRHDIDNDISKAVKLAAIERDGGVNSTYFVLLTSDFYNIFSRDSVKGLKCILSCGHEIGLHFDEVQYPEIAGDENALRDKIMWEAELLGESIGHKIRTVSMHRPGKGILESDLKIPGIINSYGKSYFKGFKYLSDSRCRWREPVDEIIESERFERLHILTHAFWYHDAEQGIEETVKRFVNTANWGRYQFYMDNFTDLPQVMAPDQVTGLKEDMG